MLFSIPFYLWRKRDNIFRISRNQSNSHICIDTDDGHHLAAVTFYKFSDLLSGLYDEFNPVGLVIMAPRLDLIKLLRSCEITILAEAEMGAICAYKTCTNYRPHIASYTHVIIMCC